MRYPTVFLFFLLLHALLADPKFPEDYRSCGSKESDDGEIKRLHIDSTHLQSFDQIRFVMDGVLYGNVTVTDDAVVLVDTTWRRIPLVPRETYTLRELLDQPQNKDKPWVFPIDSRREFKDLEVVSEIPKVCPHPSTHYLRSRELLRYI